MALFAIDAAKDAKLNYLKTNFDKLVAVVGVPTTYANCTTNLGTGAGQLVAEVAIAQGDLTIGDGPTDGRKLTVAEKAGITPNVNGTPDHYVWLDTVNSTILLYADTTPKALTTDTQVKFSEHGYIDRDPTVLV